MYCLRSYFRVYMGDRAYCNCYLVNPVYPPQSLATETTNTNTHLRMFRYDTLIEQYLKQETDQ